MPERPVRTLRFCVVLLLSPILWSLHSLSADVPTSDMHGRSFTERSAEWFGTYCLECHSEEVQKGDVDLSSMHTRDSLARNYSTWLAVLEVLREEEMPPSKATQPIEAERSEIISLIEEEMEERSQDKEGAPGAVPMRRLTRGEYHYAIEDLTGLRMDLWDILPVDAVGGEGFANQGQVQFTQASDIERYLEAAKGVAARAVVGAGDLYFFDDPGQSGQELSAIARIKKLYRARGFRTGAGEGAEPYGLDQYPKAFYACWLFQHRETLGLKGTILSEVAQSQGLAPSFVELIHDALHAEDAHPALQSVIDAWQRLPAPLPEGSFSWTQLQPTMEELFGVVVARQKELAKRKGDQEESELLDALSLQELEPIPPEALEFALVFPTVSHREPAPSDRDPIPLPFTSQYNHPERNAYHTLIKYHREDAFLVTHLLNDNERHQLDEAWNDLFGAFDYHQANLRLLYEHFECRDTIMPDIERWPEHVKDGLPEPLIHWVDRLHEHWVGVQEAFRLKEGSQVEQCMQWASMAWRRPLQASDIARLTSFYQECLEANDRKHKPAIRMLMARILSSPHFLYRMEPPSAQVGSQWLLPDLALASRLSFFLWSSIPDLELLQVASSGGFRDDEVIETQVNRMLANPKSRRMADEFFGQWFGFYRLEDYQGVDPTVFPEWDVQLKADLLKEAQLMVQDILTSHRPVSDLLLAEHGFLNERLAAHYEIPWHGDHSPEMFLKVSGLNAYDRGGLLALGAIHALTSAPQRTSVVKRGDWVLRRVLGTPVPPPPADAGSLQESDPASHPASIRELLERHQREASCVSCHVRMDPFGFALEGFDVIGKKRTRYANGLPVEEEGVLRDGTPIVGYPGIRQYFKGHMDLFYRNYCRKLIGYALGRGELLSDRALVQSMMQSLQREDPMARQILLIALSSQFRHQKALP